MATTINIIIVWQGRSNEIGCCLQQKIFSYGAGKYAVESKTNSSLAVDQGAIQVF
jgi:hypothetical protein